MNPLRAIVRHALLIALLAPAATYAANWNPGEHAHTEGAGRGPLFNTRDANISAHDAAAIQGYYDGLAVGSHCPAGLLPGGSGCVPVLTGVPLATGQPIPRTVAVEQLPPELTARLSPLYGFHYVRVGGEVLLIADDTGAVATGMPIFMR